MAYTETQVKILTSLYMFIIVELNAIKTKTHITNKWSSIESIENKRKERTKNGEKCQG